MSKKKRKPPDDVKLNLAAMLDMAFQLLTFFILTFKPSPVEGQVELRLPPPAPVTGAVGGAKAGADDKNTDVTESLDSLIISVFSRPSGKAATYAIGEGNVDNLGVLQGRLQGIFQDPNSTFKQVIIQVAPALHYSELMNVIDVCTKTKFADGKSLTKLSFVELPGDVPAQ